MREVRVLGGIPSVQTEFRTDSKKLPPNQRLKLAAPVPNESRRTLCMRCCSIPFVNILARRRSLSAIR